MITNIIAVPSGGAQSASNVCQIGGYTNLGGRSLAAKFPDLLLEQLNIL